MSPHYRWELRRDRVFCGFCDTIYTIQRLTKKLGGEDSPMITKINSMWGSDDGFLWSMPQRILAQITLKIMFSLGKCKSNTIYKIESSIRTSNWKKSDCFIVDLMRIFVSRK